MHTTAIWRPINRVAFETYVEKVLIPELCPGDIFVMGNLSSHKGPGVSRSAEAASAEPDRRASGHLGS